MENTPSLDREELVRIFRVLSHDLKSPIFSIDGFSELLNADYAEALDEEGRDFVSRIRNGVSQMKTTLEGFGRVVKLLSRPDQVETVELSDLLEEIRLKYAYRADERGVSLEIDKGAPAVRGDAEKLTELFRALVGNAIQYTDPNREDSTVRVTHSRTDGTVEIQIQDNGIGIDPSYHDQIFDIGSRLDKKNGPGSGCGLYLARAVAESHGGAVTVDSNEGEGAIFKVTLPQA